MTYRRGRALPIGHKVARVAMPETDRTQIRRLQGSQSRGATAVQQGKRSGGGRGQETPAQHFLEDPATDAVNLDRSQITHLNYVGRAPASENNAAQPNHDNQP